MLTSAARSLRETALQLKISAPCKPLDPLITIKSSKTTFAGEGRFLESKILAYPYVSPAVCWGAEDFARRSDTGEANDDEPKITYYSQEHLPTDVTASQLPHHVENVKQGKVICMEFTARPSFYIVHSQSEPLHSNSDQETVNSLYAIATASRIRIYIRASEKLLSHMPYLVRRFRASTNSLSLDMLDRQCKVNYLQFCKLLSMELTQLGLVVPEQVKSHGSDGLLMTKFQAANMDFSAAKPWVLSSESHVRPCDRCGFSDYLRAECGLGWCGNWCGKCMTTAHKYADCPKVECLKCHKLGHTATYCPDRVQRGEDKTTEQPLAHKKTGDSWLQEDCKACIKQALRYYKITAADSKFDDLTHILEDASDVGDADAYLEARKIWRRYVRNMGRKDQ